MPEAETASVSRGRLLDVASDVAWRFKAHHSYGGKDTTAIRAIRKKCPGFTPRQYANAFAKALDLYDAVEQLVRERASDLWDVSGGALKPATNRRVSIGLLPEH
jgi:hypothetical protein